METIRNYVDMMFKDLPKSKEVIDMKMNILDHMEDKYNELIAEGKTENEAIGTVISQFGNIDELKEELGIQTDKKEASITKEEQIAYKDDESVMNYLSFKNKYARMVGIGVAFCIISVIPPTFDFQRELGTILFFMIVAIGVAILIVANMENSEYTPFEKEPFQIRESLKIQLTQTYQHFKSIYSIGIASGVVLCILSPMLYMIVEDTLEWSLYDLDLNHTHVVQDIPGGFAACCFFISIAIAVFLFVWLSIKKSSFEMVLKNKQTRMQKQAEEREEKLYAIVMPLAAVIYLFIGFCFDWWHPGWIIFPLAAISVSGYYYFKNDQIS